MANLISSKLGPIPEGHFENDVEPMEQGELDQQYGDRFKERVKKIIDQSRDHFNPGQARYPKGSPLGGQWKGKGGAAAPSDSIGSGSGKSPVPKFSPDDAGAEEAAAFLQKSNPNLVVDLKGIDPQLRQMYVEEFAALQNEFPAVAQSISFFGNGMSPKATAQMRAHYQDKSGAFASAWGNRADKTTAITLNPQWDYVDLSLELAHCAKTSSKELTGFHDGMRGPKSVIRHEFGHAVDNYYNNHGSNSSIFDKTPASGIGIASYTKSKMIDAHFDYALSTSRKTGILQQSAVTGYALSSKGEFFAETFAAVRWGDPAAQRTQAVKHMKTLLKEIPPDKSLWKPVSFTTPGPGAAEWVSKASSLAKSLGIPY